MRKIKLLILCFLCISLVFTVKIYGNSINGDDLNRSVFDASSLDWRLWCYRPNVWRMNFNFEQLSGSWAEHSDLPMIVPGSVQNALKKAGVIEDWNVGVNSRNIEWIENREWLVMAKLPDKIKADEDEKIFLRCHGLDYKGILMINGYEAGRFDNAFVPYSFLISPYLKESNNNIVFIFECPPQNLAQIGWTSRITDWKPRFNYGWDWMARIVQIGIWDDIFIETVKDNQMKFDGLKVSFSADRTKDMGALSVSVKFNNLARSGLVNVTLSDESGKKLINENFTVKEIEEKKDWSNLKIKRWWPNGLGQQPLYLLTITLKDTNGNEIQQETKRIGFRTIDWHPCEGAPAEADPWICNVNNIPIFLQGVNWTPIRPNFADLTEEDYRLRLQMYKDLGVNTIRIWGGGFPEKTWLYDLCDEMGILIWQDFPLSSSGLDNYPPEGFQEVYIISQIATHYVKRLHHHPSLLLWCGGNELYERNDVAPITDKHVMIKAMKDIVSQLDPARRFVEATPSGPSIYGNHSTFGTGKNWDVHGPWDLPYTEQDKTMIAVEDYWNKDDAMFRSEVGVPGAMSVEAMNKYKGDFHLLPASMDNPLWRNVSWWLQWNEYKQTGKNLENINEYVDWSQNRQTEGLTLALKKSKDRFPACGGFIIWMGHDSYPCMINTSLIDFDGNPKPVAAELSKIWKDNSYLKFD